MNTVYKSESKDKKKTTGFVISFILFCQSANRRFRLHLRGHKVPTAALDLHERLFKTSDSTALCNNNKKNNILHYPPVSTTLSLTKYGSGITSGRPKSYRPNNSMRALASGGAIERRSSIL